MGPPRYTWETCKNITAIPPIHPSIWNSIIELLEANGNYEFGRDFLPPLFCDPFGYTPPDMGLALKIFTIATLVLTVLVVFARYMTRIFVAGRIGWDDWTIVMATMLFAAESGMGFYGVTHGGLGKHAYDLSIPSVIICLKVIFAHSILYTLNVFMVKASLLFFYKRLFPKDWTRTQRAISWFIVFQFVYAIGSCLAFALHCSPVDAFWNISKRLDGCPSFKTSIQVYSGIRGVSVICDIFVLVIPMKYVWGFKLPLKHRLGLACIFGLGFTAIGAALLRLFYQPKLLATLDISWRFVMVDFAAQLEHSLAIITASIPALTALWRRKVHKNIPRSNFSLDSKFEIDGLPSTHRPQTNGNCSELESSAISKSTIATYSSAPIDGSPLANTVSLREPIDYLSWAYHPERQNGNYANAYGVYSCKPRGWERIRARFPKRGGNSEKTDLDHPGRRRFSIFNNNQRGNLSGADSVVMEPVHVYGHKREPSSFGAGGSGGVRYGKNNSDENLVRMMNGGDLPAGGNGGNTGTSAPKEYGGDTIEPADPFTNHGPFGNQIVMTSEVVVQVSESIEPAYHHKSRRDRR